MRIKKKFHLDDVSLFKQKSIRWANRFVHFHYLNGNDLPYLYGAFPCVLAVSNQASFVLRSAEALNSLLEKEEWVFGHLGYGVAHPEYHKSHLGFQESEWFCPDTLLTFLHPNVVEIESVWMPDSVFKEISQLNLESQPKEKVQWKASETKEEYIQRITDLKKHLLRGNIYQVNFCIHFSASVQQLDPMTVYEGLNTVSPMPFSSLMKLNDRYIISASPERYLKRMNTKVISQPMKGTAPRNLDPFQDKKNIESLQNSNKERAENVMIVDLVRNDLSQVCKAGTVKVESLCEVRSFTPVHQMISTVVGELENSVSLEEIVKATFPMGSMTGAPKISAMELIQQFEAQERGAFSGALGYISPEGDFDFNVLIRSVFYNSTLKQTTYSVGGGITVLSEPEEEYKECLLKAKVIEQVLGN